MDAVLSYDLCKSYSGKTVLNKLNLQVPEGAAVACVGRANAGKTVLLRLLSGLCRPSFGDCFVFGVSPALDTEKLHSFLGTALDSAAMYREMTVSENLHFFAGLNGVNDNDAFDRISALLHGLDIWEARDEAVKDLPTGIVIRASLARALLHAPKILLMDEPREGMDQETADSIGDVLARLIEQEGMTLLLCTRDMEYAEKLCNSFALMSDGVLLGKGSLDELRIDAGVRYRAVLHLAPGEDPPRGFHMFGGQWKKEISFPDELPRIASQVISSGKTLYEIKLETPTLEETYAALLAGGIQRAGDDKDEYEDEYENEPELSAGARQGKEDGFEPQESENDKTGDEEGA